MERTWRAWLVRGALVGVVAAGSALVGCGGDDADAGVAPSGVLGAEGDSCARTADCAATLRCVNNACVVSSAGADGGISTLGGAGENCAAHRDCGDGLGCFDGRCTSAPTAGGPSLGKRGETCQVASDCEAGLACVNISGPGGSVQSICDVVDYPASPSGKTCSSECRQSTDCCQLPTFVLEPNLESCAALEAALVGIDCATTADPAQRRWCFHREAYCKCTTSPWICNAGRCTYVADCTQSGEQPGGCPSYSRLNQPLAATCNAVSHKCDGAPVGCANDEACTNAVVVDDGSDLCAAGECTCYQNKACYRRCSKDLDCPNTTTCDPATHVCLDTKQCDNDARCAQLLGDATATCTADGTCKIPCSSDLQCSPSGFGTSTFNGFVCTDAGFCEALGCASDAECTVGGVKSFCDVPQPTTATPHSAITSGL